MPRPNLPRAQGIIRAFCVLCDLPYCEDRLVGSYRQAVRYLRSGAIEDKLSALRFATEDSR